jgi:hypothetical protein
LLASGEGRSVNELSFANVLLMAMGWLVVTIVILWLKKR